MKLVEFYPNKQGRPATIPTKDMETGYAPFPPGSVSGITLRAGYTTTEQTNNYTAANLTVILANAAANPIKITLPTASANSSRYYYIKKVDSSSHLVTVTTTELIDGEKTITMGLQYQYIQVLCDATTWNIIGGVWVKLDTLIDDRLSELIQLVAQLKDEAGQSKLHLASLSDEAIEPGDADAD